MPIYKCSILLVVNDYMPSATLTVTLKLLVLAVNSLLDKKAVVWVKMSEGN